MIPSPLDDGPWLRSSAMSLDGKVLAFGAPTWTPEDGMYGSQGAGELGVGSVSDGRERAAKAAFF